MTDVTQQTVTDLTGAAEFLGRRRELSALRSDIARAGLDTLAGRPAPRSRVLLVAGRPGTGRTALAEYFAARLLDSGDYPDGLLRAGLTEPGGAPVPVTRVASDLLEALGVPVVPGADEEDATAALREALTGRRAVLLLDDVDDAEPLADLIPDDRHCLVLAVARGPLVGVPDVRPCTVGGLDRNTAVRLLVRGAGDIRVTVDPSAADRLAELCGDLPAALRLAAGWLAAHPETAVAEAVRRLVETPDPVGEDGAPRDAVDAAEAPLSRAFALAHSALPAATARMLRLLALAPAGLVDAHTAAALVGCPVPTARATLAELTGFGMLRSVVAETGSGDPDQYRVPGCLAPRIGALLDTLERPGEALLARARMLERIVTRLRACQAVAEPPPANAGRDPQGSPAREWLAGLPAALRFETPQDAAHWFATRRPMLLAAARTAAAGGELDTLARRLFATLSRVLIAQLPPAPARAEVYRLHELALSVAERRRLTRERAAALLSLGDMDADAGRPRAALDRYRAAYEVARNEREPEDTDAVGRALESIADTYAELDDWQRAADWYGRALPLSQTRGDLAGTARLHGRVGAALIRTGEWTEALRAWRAAAAAHRRLGDVPAQAWALAEVALAQERMGRPEDALRTGSDALRLAERTAGVELQAELRLRLADCAEQLGRGEAAAAHRAAADRLRAEATGGTGGDRARREPEAPERTITPPPAPTLETQTPAAND
ncbi:tetratricopeptide repeat protein [Streptomyces sp. DSM 44918]|uniref:Tetratricopeptide repeat protein n=1 Tax=Streptomyces millisiae TaxID=3075542 RepID=A0ABU2LXR2_9ACTN|nr:tetratricopeptide repeat protein [Streptomyces sp. DSM 44918]MDT0321972.1 tetratricopeptide repeat protein [Streptomyces sp. DSM 44918]